MEDPDPESAFEEVFKRQCQHGVGSRISDKETGFTEEYQADDKTWVPKSSSSRSKLTQDLPRGVSKFRKRGLESFDGICNKDTISKDNTTGNESFMDDLLARCGRRVMGTHHQERQDEIREDTSTSQSDENSLVDENSLGEEELADKRTNLPPPIPKEYQDRTNAALEYIQASRLKGSRANHISPPTDSPDVDGKAYESSGSDESYSPGVYNA
ncbi:hypothetical protein FOXYS1_4203, partial [Fusarium oxysporum]